MPPTVAVGRVCFACPHCGNLNAPHRKSHTWPCRKCGREFENSLTAFIEGKVDLDDKAPDLPVKVLGNEVPSWAVKTALGLAGIVVVAVASLIALRLSNPEAFRAVMGAFADVKTSFISTGETTRFERNLTFFVPGDGSAESEGKWTSLHAMLRKDGAVGYTRWRVEGFDGTEIRPGHFVLMSIPMSDGKPSFDETALKDRFHQVYGIQEPFFVINEQLH